MRGKIYGANVRGAVILACHASDRQRANCDVVASKLRVASELLVKKHQRIRA